MTIAFVGSLVFNEKVNKKNGFSIAGNNFQKRILKASIYEHIYSIFPLYMDSITVEKDAVKKFGNISILGLDLNGNRNFYIINILYAAIQFILITVRKKNRKYLVYNLEYQNILICIILKILRKKIYIVCADYIEYDNKYVNKIIKYFYKQASGVITLRSELRLNVNQVSIPGFYDIDLNFNEFKKYSRRTIMISGSIGNKTGLDLIEDLARLLPEYIIVITGKGFEITDKKLKEVISFYACKYKNIKFYGLVEAEKYKSLLESSLFALSLRNPSYAEHKANFPSKIIEYLSFGKFVISTLEYKDLDEEHYTYAQYSAESISNKIKCIENLTDNEIDLKVNSINKYAQKNFSLLAFQNKLNELLSK